MKTLFAIAVPILPGKTEAVKEFAHELSTTYHDAFAESRNKMNVQERTFLQSTPMGDIVIITLEGENPAEAFKNFAAEDNEFTRFFAAKVKELHGLDLHNPPEGALPELIADSMSLALHED